MVRHNSTKVVHRDFHGQEAVISRILIVLLVTASALGTARAEQLLSPPKAAVPPVRRQLSAEAESRFAPLVFQGLVAALANDKVVCDECLRQISELREESEEYFILGCNSRMVIASAMNDRDLFVTEFASLSFRNYSSAEFEELATDCMQVALTGLCPMHSGWGLACLASAVEQSGRRINERTVLLLEQARIHLPGEEYEDLITGFVDRLVEESSKSGGMNDTIGWHRLIGLALPVYRSRIKTEKLWLLARMYVDQFGESGPQSVSVVTLALDASNCERRTQENASDRSVVPGRDWLVDVHDRFVRLGQQKQSKSLQEFHEAWNEFQNNEAWMRIGRVQLADLQKDPRLNKIVSAKLEASAVTVQNLCEVLSSETAMRIRMSDESDPRLVASGPVNLEGPAVSAFQLILASPLLNGEWHRTTDGYAYHSKISFEEQRQLFKQTEVRTTPQQPDNRRRLLMLVNAIAMGALIIYLLGKRRKQ